MKINLLIAALLCSLLSFAIQSEELKRPKICLVLKGGGALGFAHVGALKVLEEARVPIDCIAGTSIGSIVGAAYATGNTVEDMNRVMIETDWEKLFGEQIDRSDLDFRLKAGRNREIFGDTKIAFKNGKFAMPKGVVEGQNIRILFQDLFGHLPVPVNFDSLPVPFRAVTADLEKAESYVPASGDLARVVRASMSVPGAFSPVEMDSRILIDGGITNNLPIDVALQMGAEKLIVIDLISKLAEREHLDTPFSISGQMVSMLLMQNAKLSRQLVRPGDIVIEPNVSDFGVTDFNQAEKLMAIGEEAARKVLADIKTLSIPIADYQKYSQRRTGQRYKNPKIDFIKINNQAEAYTDERIEKNLDVKPGDDFVPEKVEAAVNELYKTGYFRSVDYSLVQEGEQTGIEINTKGKEWEEKFVRLGFAVEDNLDGDSNFRLATAYRFADPIFNDGYGEAQLEIGKNPKAKLEFYQPLWASPYFVDHSISYSQSQIFYRQDGNAIAQYQNHDGLAQFNIGRSLDTLGEFSVGVARGFGDVERQIGEPILPDFSYDTGELRAEVLLDTLDTPDFPTRGFSASLRGTQSLQSLGSQDEFADISGSLMKPFSFGSNTIILSTNFANTFDDRPVEKSYSLGGFLSVSGYEQNSIQAADYVSGQVLYLRRFSGTQNPFFQIAYYLGGSFELTQAYNDAAGLEDYNLLKSGSIFYGLDTPLLPLYLGFGLSSDQEQSVYISLGRIGKSR